MRYSLLIVLFLHFAFQPAYAALLYGDIYEGDTFSPLNNTIIRIDGPMSVQFIAHQNYSIKLPLGEYVLSASSFTGRKCDYYAQERINLNQDTMRFDIVLLPCELQQLVPPVDEIPESAMRRQSNEQALLLIAFVLLALAVWLFFRHLSVKKGKMQRYEERPEEDVAESGHPLDEDSRRILDILKSSGGRMLQKELRQIIGASQSNTSLVLTELEHLGYIKRFKRGRENLLKLLKEPQ